MLLTAVLLPAPEGGFTALNPETGCTSEGETVEEALANLKEAIDLYFEEFSPSAGLPEEKSASVRRIKCNQELTTISAARL